MRGLQAHGLETGPWVAWGTPIDFAGDQRAEDGRSLCFTSQPLDDRLELFGVTEFTVVITSDRANAILAVRLCDVAPDGSSTLVSLGVLNLTHRESHEHPVPLVPGEPAQATVRLKAAAYAFPAGHRIRIGLSPTLWPWAWPSPEPVTLTVVAGGMSRLELPVRPPRPEDDDLSPFEEPEFPPPLEVERAGVPRGAGRSVRRDLASSRHELIGVGVDHFGARRLVRDELLYVERAIDTFEIAEGEPLSAMARSEWTIELERGDWRVRVETSSALSGDAEAFGVTNVLDAYEGDARIFAKTWSRRLPRDLV